MKKLILITATIFLASGKWSFAEDLVKKRQNIATNAVTYSTRLVDDLRALKALSEERAEAGNFLDSDFVGTDLVHLSSYTIGVLLDVVIPDIDTTYQETLNKAILLKVRK